MTIEGSSSNQPLIVNVPYSFKKKKKTRKRREKQKKSMIYRFYGISSMYTTHKQIDIITCGQFTDELFLMRLFDA